MEMSGRRKQKSPRRLSEDVEHSPDEPMNPSENSPPEPASSLCHLCKYEFSGPGQLAIHLRYVHQQIAQISPRGGRKGPGEVEGQRSDLDQPEGEVEDDDDDDAEGEDGPMSHVGDDPMQDELYDDENAARRRMFVQSNMPDDRYIYCEECKERYEGECPMHPFTIIEDKPVPPECENRARLTLPDFLSIRKSGIEGVGDGVFSERHIPKGVRFGPYAGEIVSNDAGYWSGYAWEICVQGRVIHCVDGKNENKGNWLRYVNCARSLTEQNLVAFQYLGQIYYHTCKLIEPGTELLVYYGEEFAKKLDVISELTSLMYDPKSSTYKCEFCGRMYTIAIYLARHLRYSHNKIIRSSSASHQAIRSVDRESLASMVADYAAYLEQKAQEEALDGQSSSQVNGGHEPGHDPGRDPSQFASMGRMTPDSDSRSSIPGPSELVFEDPPEREEGIMGYRDRNGDSSTLDLSTMRYPEDEQEEEDVGSGENGSEHMPGEGEGEKGYECGVCGQRFDLELVYNAHMITHSVTDGHRCGTCGDFFPTREDLEGHACLRSAGVELHGEAREGQPADDANKPFQCTVCSKRFREREYLRTHLRIHTGEKPYQCRFCEKSFTQGSARNTHERTHTKLKPFVCDVPTCGMRFRDSSHLRMHKRMHIDNRPFQCRFCGKCYLFASQLLQHELTHSTTKPYVCGICNRGFNQKAYLRVHERLHTGEKPYPCRACGKRFNQMTSRNVHEQKHGNWGVYDCKKCSLSFKRSRDLLRHECHGNPTANGIPPMPLQPAPPPPPPPTILPPQPLQPQVFPCKQCPDIFQTSSELRQHQQTHVLRPFQCQICSKRFTHRSYLEIHVRIHTGEKPYSCKYCGKTFSQTSSRNAHERIHERIKAEKEAVESQVQPQEPAEKADEGNDKVPENTNGNTSVPTLPPRSVMQSCRYCNKTFMDATLLINHEQTHLRPRDHVCGFCGKAFSKGRYLQIHERTHTGEKPYQCRYCTKRFTQGSSRNVHERIHVRNGDYKLGPLTPLNQMTPLSPTQMMGHQTIPAFNAQNQSDQTNSSRPNYYCRYCNLQFTDTAALAHHEKVHGIRPFICNICGRTFTQSRYLQIHVRTHIGEQPYPCHYCSKRFSQCSARNMHERIHTEFRPHQCPICGKSFIVNSALQKHLQKHQSMDSAPAPTSNPPPPPQQSLITL